MCLGPEYTWKGDSAGLADELEGMCWRKRSRDSYLCGCKGGVTINQDVKGYWKSRFWGEEREFSPAELILRDLSRGEVSSLQVNTRV